MPKTMLTYTLRTCVRYMFVFLNLAQGCYVSFKECIYNIYIYTYIQWKGLCPSKTAFSYENPLGNKRTALQEQSPGFSVFPAWKKCVSCYVTLERLRKHCCFSIDSHIQVQQSWNKTKPTINGSLLWIFTRNATRNWCLCEQESERAIGLLSQKVNKLWASRYGRLVVMLGVTMG